MRIRRENYAFLFSVEGETEKWYLEHLQKLINDALTAKTAPFTLTLNVKVEKSPKSYIKTLSPGIGVTERGKMIITHVFDYESPIQQKGMDRLTQFQERLQQMKKAAELKNVKYRLAYSNLSFDLWIILHKQNCNGMKTSCSQYLQDLNSAYRHGKTPFASMKQYKEERSFKEILEEITLSDVRDAIKHAETIEAANAQNYRRQIYCGYRFFVNNPSLSFHERIQELFDFCKKQGCSV